MESKSWWVIGYDSPGPLINFQPTQTSRYQQEWQILICGIFLTKKEKILRNSWEIFWPKVHQNLKKHVVLSRSEKHTGVPNCDIVKFSVKQKNAWTPFNWKSSEKGEKTFALNFPQENNTYSLWNGEKCWTLRVSESIIRYLIVE